MPYISLNPATNLVVDTQPSWDSARLADTLARLETAQEAWSKTDFEQRAAVLTRVADVLRERRNHIAAIVTREMGKPIREARAEVERAALIFDYYAVHGGPFLDDEFVSCDAGKSYVAYHPLGVVLGVMPWDFPVWQAARFVAPALMAGNACVLKPAHNVPHSTLAMEAALREGGLPADLFAVALIEPEVVEEAIASPFVHAVMLAGSEQAGRRVAGLAGQHLKKCVLELGGSDPFLVLADADLDMAATAAVASRFGNCGQSCIAAKRFIVMPGVAEEFTSLLRDKASALKLGDPTAEDTQLGPMASAEFRSILHRQVADSIAAGAEAILGCEPVQGSGAYYPASILRGVRPGSPAYADELFGPVASVIVARDEDDAIRIANDTRFGLGASLWSRDYARAETLAGRIVAGSTFINGMVKADPRLPFGGTKASGFGRELSYHGIRELTNAKAVWIREGYRPNFERRRQERRRADRRSPS